MLNKMNILMKEILNLKWSGDHVRILKYKNISAKGYKPNWSEEFFAVSKIKNTVRWTCVISNLNCEAISGIYYGKELEKNDQEKLK